MVYEIYFEPKGNIWRIRITTYYLLFFSLSHTICEAVKPEGKHAKFVPLNFQTFTEAAAHADKVGLDSMYLRRERGGTVAWANAEAAHVAS